MHLIAHPTRHGTSVSTIPSVNYDLNRTSALYSAANDAADTTSTTSPTNQIFQCYLQKWSHVAPTLHIQEDGMVPDDTVHLSHIGQEDHRDDG